MLSLNLAFNRSVILSHLSDRILVFIMSTHLHFSAHKGATKERTYPRKSYADNPQLQCCLLSFGALYEPRFRFFFILPRTQDETSTQACYLSFQSADWVLELFGSVGIALIFLKSLKSISRPEICIDNSFETPEWLFSGPPKLNCYD